MIDEQTLLIYILEAENQTIISANREAIKWSAGTVDKKTLTRMGHPFAVRAAKFGLRLNEFLINMQSEEFIKSWVRHGPNIIGDTIESKLYNKAPYAKFLAEGTNKMIQRPIMVKILRNLEYKRMQNLKRALKHGLTG